MIDLHVHILPGVDDGAAGMEESLQMARLAAASGVHAMAVTPHCNIPGVCENYDGPTLRQHLKTLREAVHREKIELELFCGMEVFGRENLAELLDKKLLAPINDGIYLLIEFPFEESADWMTFLLEQVLKAGYVPLVAHPERYEAVKYDPQIAWRWVRMGCALQVNKGSILGRFGRGEQRTAMLLVEHELVACVASDAHHADIRTPHMGEAANYLENCFGGGCVQLLLEDNPARILDSREIVLLEPRGFRRDWF